MAVRIEVVLFISTAMLTLGFAVNARAQAAPPRIAGFGQSPAAEAPPAQTERLAQINPRSINRGWDGAVVALAGDEIERIDLSGVLIRPRPGEGEDFEIDEEALAAQLGAALSRMRMLTLRERPVALAIRRAYLGPVNDPGQLSVRVNRLLDGIPVEPDGLILVDAVTGRIQSFAMSLLPDSVQGGDRRLWISEQQAGVLAQDAIVSEHGGALPAVVAAEIRYVQTPEAEVRPEWVITCGSHTALVDAASGNVRTFSNAIQ